MTNAIVMLEVIYRSYQWELVAVEELIENSTTQSSGREEERFSRKIHRIEASDLSKIHPTARR